MQNSNPAIRIYWGMGGNARYTFDSSLGDLNYKTNELQWGIHFMFGMKFGHFFFEDYFMRQFNDLFDTGAGDPKARINLTTFKIGWVF